MTKEKQLRLQACLKELATLLYDKTDTRQLRDLESIEKTVKNQILVKEFGPSDGSRCEILDWY